MLVPFVLVLWEQESMKVQRRGIMSAQKCLAVATAHLSGLCTELLIMTTSPQFQCGPYIAPRGKSGQRLWMR